MDPIHLILPGENDYFTAEAYKVLDGEVGKELLEDYILV